MLQTLEDALLAYSEYLDSAGLIKSEFESTDDRSHEKLVADFLADA